MKEQCESLQNHGFEIALFTNLLTFAGSMFLIYLGGEYGSMPHVNVGGLTAFAAVLNFVALAITLENEVESGGSDF